MSFIGTITEFHSGEDWEVYAERLEQFLMGNEIREERKVAVFISIIGQETYSLLRDLCFPEKPSTKKYEELVGILNRHFKPKASSISVRYKFRNCVQTEGESIVEYLARLKRESRNCEFEGNLEDSLRDQFVCGIRDRNIKKRLLQEPGLTYARALEIACAMETVDKNAEDLCRRNPVVPSINKVRAHKPAIEKRWRSRQGQGAQEQKVSHGSCTRCGGDHNEKNCSKKNWTCHNCHKRGHLARYCRSLKRQYGNRVGSYSRPPQVHTLEGLNSSSETEEELITSEVKESRTVRDTMVETLETIANVESNPAFRYLVTVEIEGSPLKMEVDTGAVVSVITEDVYKRNFAQIPVKRSSMQLKTYTGENINVIGTIDVEVKYNDQRICLPLAVVPLAARSALPLLGRNWLQKLHLDWKQIFHGDTLHAMHSDNNAAHIREALISKYSKVFRNPLNEPIKQYKADICLKEDTIPVFAKARPIPFSLRDKVEHELTRLEKDGIIEKVTRSDWATPLVVVPKENGAKVRLCGDYSITINRSCRTDHYPLPTTEDLFASLSGGKIFTKLDLTNAYLQLELTEASKAILTVNTHMGLFQYKRLPFGVASAPALFQSVMDRILAGIPKVFCYLDDILITGSNLEENKALTIRVLNRLQEYHVQVNLGKSMLFSRSVEYLGHKIDELGIHPTEAKVEALQKAPEPTNVSELRAFLGLLNYYRRFLPHLATKLQPLYELLQVDRQWKWTQKCREVFLEAKAAILTDNVLVHFDSSKPLVLTCDASSVGLGAVLSHVWDDHTERPIGFVSRTLTSTEMKYAQLEKEAAALIFGVQKFHRFLYGRKFTLVTDHKPLVRILGPTTGIPPIAAARLQRWAVILSAYQYDIQYKDGTLIGNADSLSRLPLKSSTNIVEDENISYFAPLRETPLAVLDVATATRRDRVLARVLDWTRYGWPKEVDPEFTPYTGRKEELSVEQDCLTWGSRVIIPETLRSQVLELLHEEHPGMVRMKMLARSYLWWPNLDHDIENRVRTCPVCQACLSSSPPRPLQPWNWATSPWERVHLDLAFRGNLKFLILFDSFSKWIEIIEIPYLTSEKIIDVLRKVFAQFGLPGTVVHDNGRQFTSGEFREFLRTHGIKDISTPVYHPASNGAAERGIQTVKRALRKLAFHDQHYGRRSRSIQEKLDSYLLSYRSTPQTTTGQTPAELFLKRQLRTRISQLKPSLNEAMKVKTENLKLARDKKRGPSENFMPGSKVYVRSLGRKDVNWIPGQVVRRIGQALYLVKLERGVEKVIHMDHLRQRQAFASSDEQQNGQF